MLIHDRDYFVLVLIYFTKLFTLYFQEYQNRSVELEEMEIELQEKVVITCTQQCECIFLSYHFR